MSGGGGSTTTQKADPWSGIQPSLTSLYGNLNSAYNAGQLAPTQNTGEVAPWNQNYADAIMGTINAGMNGTAGDGTLNGAIGQTQKIAGGDLSGLQGAGTLQGFASGNYGIDPVTGKLAQVAQGNTSNAGAFTTLGNMSQGNFSGTGLDQLVKTSNGAYTDPNNPAVQALFNAQAQPLTKQFQNSTLPGLLSAYSAAGRYGSGANDAAIGSASDSLGQTLANLSQSTIGTNYANERANQQSAAGTLAGYQTGAASNLAGLQSQLGQYLTSLRSGSAGTLAGIQGSAISALPGMAAQQSQNTWNGLSNALNAGQILQGQNQDVVNSRIAQQNYYANQPLMGLNNLSGLLQNGMSLNGQSSTTTGGTSTAAKVGTGALSGAATGAAIGSVFPGIGTAIGAGVGAIGGGLLGVM